MSCRAGETPRRTGRKKEWIEVGAREVTGSPWIKDGGGGVLRQIEVPRSTVPARTIARKSPRFKHASQAVEDPSIRDLEGV